MENLWEIEFLYITIGKATGKCENHTKTLRKPYKHGGPSTINGHFQQLFQSLLEGKVIIPYGSKYKHVWIAGYRPKSKLLQLNL